jgi:hypothetical protein
MTSYVVNIVTILVIKLILPVIKSIVPLYGMKQNASQ